MYFTQKCGWHRPAELVAKFMDERLRGGQKGQSDEELDNTLDKALMLFRYIQVPHLLCQLWLIRPH